MFKVGDKIVCINSGELIVKLIGGGPNSYIRKKPVKQLKENKIYTVGNENGGARDLNLIEIGDDFYYSWERFVSLIEYRKLKLQKICTTLEKK